MTDQTEREALVQAIASSLAMSYGSHVSAPKGGRDWKAAEDLLGVLRHLGLHRPTPRTVTTVEALADVLPGIELTREFDVTDDDATIIGEYLAGLGYILAPAPAPVDQEALALRVCHARLGHMTPGTYACDLCRGEVDRVLAAIEGVSRG